MSLLCEKFDTVEEPEFRFRLSVVIFRSLEATPATSTSKADRTGVDCASELVAGCECGDEDGASAFGPFSLWSAASCEESAFVLMLEVPRSSMSESEFILRKALRSRQDTGGQCGTTFVYTRDEARRHWRFLSRRGTMRLQLRCNIPHKLCWRCLVPKGVKGRWQKCLWRIKIGRYSSESHGLVH